MSKARAWCFTLNNPQEEDFSRLRSLGASTESHNVRYLLFGRETAPTTGTAHLQGYVYTVNPVSMTGIKRMIGEAHFEKAKGSPQQNRDYCTKDKDFEEFGTIPAQGKRTDIQTFVDAAEAGPLSKRTIIQEFGGVLAKYPRFVDAVLDEYRPKPTPEPLELKPWQKTVSDYLSGPADTRRIIFCVDLQGEAGKTRYAAWLLATMPGVLYLRPGRFQDMAYLVSRAEGLKVVILDVPASEGSCFDYGFLESLKDGILCSYKYEPRSVTFDRLHVIVMMNFEPDLSKLGQNRSIIIQAEK